MGAVTLYQMWDMFPWCQAITPQIRWENRQSIAAGAEDTACAPIQLLYPHLSSPSTQPQLLVLSQVVLLLGECGWRVKPGKADVCTQLQDGGWGWVKASISGLSTAQSEKVKQWKQWDWEGKGWEGDPARHHSEEKLSGEAEERPKCHWPFTTMDMLRHFFTFSSSTADGAKIHIKKRKPSQTMMILLHPRGWLGVKSVKRKKEQGKKHVTWSPLGTFPCCWR